MCGPARSAGRTDTPLPAPPLPIARWRRRHEAPPPRPVFVPSRPRASHRAPRRAPDTRGLPRSRVSASRHSRCYGLVTSVRIEPSHVPSGPESWAGVPGGDYLAPAGARTLAGRRTERPPRPPPAPPLRGGRPRQPPIGTLGEEASPIRSPLLLREPAP